jgi:hypothetical protein
MNQHYSTPRKPVAVATALELLPPPPALAQTMPARPLVARCAEDLPLAFPPYSSIIETDCDDCGGDGRNHDLDDDYEPCDHCIDGKQSVLRNWLGEAFQIENGQLEISPRREHLTAIRHYATQMLKAERQVA